MYNLIYKLISIYQTHLSINLLRWMWLFTTKNKSEVMLVLTKHDDIENASEYQNVSIIPNPSLQKGKWSDDMT
jgi:hypothetical protein